MVEYRFERNLMTVERWVEVLSWRNDPLVYVWSRTNKSISLAEHLAWLDNRQNRFDTEPVFAYSVGKSFIGTTRLDRLRGDNYEVSLIVNPEYRGKGYGRTLLTDICEYFLSNMPSTSKLIAIIHSENEVSQRTFRSLGFETLSKELNFETLALSRY